MIKLIQLSISILLCALLFSGCSGGSASPQTITPVQMPSSSSTYGSLLITKNILQFGDSTNVTASFKKTDGTPASGISVNFSTTIGTILPASGIALTDGNGIAVVQLIAGTNAGQGQITAVATVDSRQVSTNASFSINLPPLKLGTIQLDNSTISYGATTTLRVQVYDINMIPYTSQPVEVTFTSAQAALGSASITKTARTDASGIATATYTSLTNSGIDTITALIAGDSKTANITVTSLDTGSISFVSATPITIVLKGMAAPGLSETSKVVFKVLDTNGLPKVSQPVDFTLYPSTAGLIVLPSSASSDQYGVVSTTVQAGTTSTSFRVIATVRGTTIVSESAQMVVSTGVPANISTSFATLASESLNYDGIIVPVTARLSDSMQNPVQDGTAVYFTTDCGSVGASCFTANGSCSVNWTSQTPRTLNGIVSITSSAVGANGSAVSQTSTIVSASSRPKDSSFTLTGTVNPASAAIVGPPAVPSMPQSSVLDLTVQDANGNSMPSGTTIAVSSSATGLTFLPASFAVPDTTTTGAGITTFKVGVTNSNTTGGSGSIIVTVTTPKLVTTTKTFNFSW